MLEVIRKRRSVRRFEARPIEEETIELLAEAVLRAPTSRDLRHTEFVFVTDPEKIRALSLMKPTGAAFLAGAPLAVAVLGDESRCDIWVEDASIAAITLQLAATSLGLGSCWSQVRERPHASGRPAEDFVREMLGIEPRLRVLCVIGIGHPAEKPVPVPSDRLDRSRIHRVDR